MKYTFRTFLKVNYNV